MSSEKASGYISSILFNNGNQVAINQNDIVILVGPNNVGKSQSLKDIYALSSEKSPTVVVSDIEITKTPGTVAEALDEIALGVRNGSYKEYSILNDSFTYGSFLEKQFFTEKYYGVVRNAFVVNLDTTARLTICNPPRSIRRDAPKKHPIHYAAYKTNYRKWLTENFKKAFGVDIVPNIQFGSEIPLCIGELIPFGGEYKDAHSFAEDYGEKLALYKQVQEQGDGIRSFTGILLYLMLDYYKTYLIDEPESFLHPPQARIMGQIIGQTLSNEQQAFISTHSEDIIKGLVEVCPERLKIIRITRKNDINDFSILEYEKLSTVWNDPLLRYSNIMSSLFHKSVVLCESDSDCKFYSIVESHLKRTVGMYSEALFIHCGGKHRMAKIIGALRALNVELSLIPDIDVLNDKEIFKGIVEAFGLDWKDFESDYNIIASNLHSPKEYVETEKAKHGIDSVFNSANGKNLSKREIEQIKAEVKIISKWNLLKEAGYTAIPKGDATAAFKRLNQICKENRIFIVPVGELECFVKDVGKHAPEWVNTVLEKYPNLDDDVYSDVREFIAQLGL